MLYEPERWKVLLLCEKASTEQDPRKLAALISQICDLLEKFERKRSHPDGRAGEADPDSNMETSDSSSGSAQV
jgi:hypothetical protein